MFKKVIATALTLTMVLGLAACGQRDPGDDNHGGDGEDVSR